MSDREVTVTFYSGKVLVLRASEVKVSRWQNSATPGYKSIEWDAPKSRFSLFSFDPSRVDSVTALPWTMFSKEGVF